MRKLFRIVFIFLLQIAGTAQAQSVFDSLKKVYPAQYVFEHRYKGSADKFISTELANITDLEVRQFAASAMVSNVYGYGWTKNEKLIALLDSIIEAPASGEVKNVAMAVKAEVLRSLVGTKIQPLTLPSTTGDTLRITQYYSAGFDYVVVDLWATWCGPCLAEMKKFNTLRKQYNIKKVERFVKSNPQYQWPIVFAGKNSTLSEYFKIRYIPAFVIVDRSGSIVAHTVGKGLEDELHKLYKK
jgi:thiol-disulfide isomerase/thioredoxin